MEIVIDSVKNLLYIQAENIGEAFQLGELWGKCQDTHEVGFTGLCSLHFRLCDQRTAVEFLKEGK